MKKSKKLCRTNATAILKFFYFKDDTFAFFYEIRKNGLVKYYVNCNKKVYGPYEKVGKSHDPEIADFKGKSYKTFAWECVINDEEYIFIGGKNCGKKKIPTWEDTMASLDKMCEEIGTQNEMIITNDINDVNKDNYSEDDFAEAVITLVNSIQNSICDFSLKLKEINDKM